MSEVYVETGFARNCRVGHVTVGQVVTQLMPEGCAKVCHGILLRCPGSADPVPNTACVWVSTNPDITCDSDPATGGVPIPPGQNISMPVQEPDQVFLRSTADGQDVAYMMV